MTRQELIEIAVECSVPGTADETRMKLQDMDIKAIRWFIYSLGVDLE
jgi:hypothetical protein